MNEEKLNFIRKEFMDLVRTLPATQKGKWGKMNAQQMIEHMTYSVRFANGRNFHQPMLPQEQLDKVRSFFLSEKLFRENTRNALLPEEPDPMRNVNMETAMKELENELDEWIRIFSSHEKEKTMNPFAGEFTFDEWVTLFHKHFVHHARQFGLVV